MLQAVTQTLASPRIPNLNIAAGSGSSDQSLSVGTKINAFAFPKRLGQRPEVGRIPKPKLASSPRGGNDELSVRAKKSRPNANRMWQSAEQLAGVHVPNCGGQAA